MIARTFALSTVVVSLLAGCSAEPGDEAFGRDQGAATSAAVAQCTAIVKPSSNGAAGTTTTDVVKLRFSDGKPPVILNACAGLVLGDPATAADTKTLDSQAGVTCSLGWVGVTASGVELDGAFNIVNPAFFGAGFMCKGFDAKAPFISSWTETEVEQRGVTTAVDACKQDIKGKATTVGGSIVCRWKSDGTGSGSGSLEFENLTSTAKAIKGEWNTADCLPWENSTSAKCPAGQCGTSTSVPANGRTSAAAKTDLTLKDAKGRIVSFHMTSPVDGFCGPFVVD